MSNKVHSLRQEKEDQLHIFARKLRMTIPYATVHSDDYPPSSVEKARERIIYLRRQDAQILKKILAQIEAEGRRLKCSRKAKARAKHKIEMIEDARIAETKLLEKWISKQTESAPALTTLRA